MNLGGTFPFDLDAQQAQRIIPKKTFAKAQCPYCKAPHEANILDDEFFAHNLVCANCKKGFCSFCNNNRHLFGQCSDAQEVKRRTNIKPR